MARIYTLIDTAERLGFAQAWPNLGFVRKICVLFASLLLMAAGSGAPPELVDVMSLHPKFAIDIKYATTDNFFGQKVYPEARCILRKVVAERMVKAQAWLDKEHPGLRLLFKDCYRPDPVQHVLWNAVKGTKKAAYVANPNTRTGSIHSYGAAVDLTLADAKGHELDMGTAYDHLGVLAEPRHEKRFLKEGKLSKTQVAHRHILRRAMTIVGMKTIRNEWWHFNADRSSVIRKKYKRLSVPFSDIARPATQL